MGTRLKKFFGVSNYIGAKRALSELQYEKQEMEIAVKQNHRDAEVCKRRLAEIEKEIPKAQAKVDIED